jgi:hypothetical protein
MIKGHVFVVGIAMAAMLAACGSASTDSGTAAPPDTSAGAAFSAGPASAAAATPTPTAQQQFALLVDYLNSGIVVWQSATNITGLTPAQLAAAAGPLESQFKTFDQGLANYPWPANTAADVKTLIHVDQAIEQDLATAAAGQVAQNGLSSWITHEASDDNLNVAESKLVRADLGLGLS